MNKGQIVSMQMPTHFGDFKLYVWPGERGRELVALTTPTLDPAKEVMLRIHTECLTGDIFMSHTCDCGEQKEIALQALRDHGNGIFVYHRQEGRNMGLYKKIQAYALMQRGTDTHEANIQLSEHPDGRDYRDVLIALDILLQGTKSGIKLLTNNPYKKLFLERYGYAVTAQALNVGTNRHNAAYADTKHTKFLHGAIDTESYVGITLLRNDLAQAPALARVIRLSETRGKAINLGLGIFQEKGDTKDDSLAHEINDFARVVVSTGVRLVIHIDWPGTRHAYRELKSFLGKLSCTYSLQFRLRRPIEKIDVELIEALHAERVIFQIRPSQMVLLDDPNFREYFSRPYRSILIDSSWGTGQVADIKETQEVLLEAIRRGVGRIGVAGGFSAETVYRVFELEDYFKIPISVDAESRLRENGSISLPKMEAYLNAALAVQN